MYSSSWCTHLHSIVYSLRLTADEKGKFDELVEQNGVQVLIDSPALMHLFGTRIDFVEDRIRYGALTAVADNSSCTSIVFGHCDEPLRATISHHGRPSWPENAMHKYPQPWLAHMLVLFVHLAHPKLAAV